MYLSRKPEKSELTLSELGIGRKMFSAKEYRRILGEDIEEEEEEEYMMERVGGGRGSNATTWGNFCR